MFKFPIGVMLNSFKKPFEEAVYSAAKLGVDGVQFYTSKGRMSPENLTLQDRKNLLKTVNENGLKISALCGDFGHGFGDRELNKILVPKSKQELDLACDLETKIVTTHIGVIPSNKENERYKIMQEACFELFNYAEKQGQYFAIETGPETADVLKGFLDSIGSKGGAVNLDPANLVMVTGDDPVKAVYTLKDYIVHTHAKDGIKLKDKDPEIIYGIIEEEIEWAEVFKELPLGEGGVDFKGYLNALDEIGYKGFLTIERETGLEPEKDIEKAVSFLKNAIK